MTGRGLHNFEEVTEISRGQRSQWGWLFIGVQTPRAVCDKQAGRPMAGEPAGDNGAHGEALIFFTLPLRSVSASPRDSESQRAVF